MKRSGHIAQHCPRKTSAFFPPTLWRWAQILRPLFLSRNHKNHLFTCLSWTLNSTPVPLSPVWLSWFKNPQHLSSTGLLPQQREAEKISVSLLHFCWGLRITETLPRGSSFAESVKLIISAGFLSSATAFIFRAAHVNSWCALHKRVDFDECYFDLKLIEY